MSRSAVASMNTWHTPSRCLITGTFASRAMRSIRLLPPRGTITSTCFSSAIRWPTAARSVVATTCTAFSGRPAARSPSCTHAAIAWLLRSASEPPRRIVALPALRHSARGVGGHVGPRFVDDADHAERHAHPADLDAGRAVAQVGDLADRIGQRRDLLEPVRHRCDRLRREREAVDERRRRVRPRARPRRPRRSPRGAAPRRGGSPRPSPRSAAFFAAVSARASVARRGARGLADAAHVRGDVGERAEARDVEVRHAAILARIASVSASQPRRLRA